VWWGLCFGMGSGAERTAIGARAAVKRAKMVEVCILRLWDVVGKKSRMEMKSCLGKLGVKESSFDQRKRSGKFWVMDRG